ncbi:hypothetical protein A2U01_0044187, partial [Trifolium medium]|nr:hypothetical protein [Trifolium medium]
LKVTPVTTNSIKPFTSFSGDSVPTLQLVQLANADIAKLNTFTRV